MVELDGRGTAVDFVLLGEELARVRGAAKGSETRQELRAFAAELANQTTSAYGVGDYASRVRSSATLRALHQMGPRIAESAATCPLDPEDVSDLVGKLESRLYRMDSEVAKTEPSSLREGIAQAFRDMEAAAQRDGRTGLRTGFYDLDDMLCGLKAGDLVIVGARPSMGKTAFGFQTCMWAALNTAHHIERQANVLFFSAEMQITQIALRALSLSTGLPAQALQSGRLTEEDWGNVSAARDAIERAPLAIDDTPKISVRAIRAKARHWAATTGLDMILVDYVQLVQPAHRHKDRHLEVAAIGRDLKTMARELGIPVIAISQLSRAVESRADKRPMLSDLKESGDLEQDADVVLLLYRAAYYDGDAPMSDAEVICAKNRGGPTGTIKLLWDGQGTRFKNPSQDLAYVTEL